MIRPHQSLDRTTSQSCIAGLTRCKGTFGQRHVMAFLAFLGFVNVYALRVNLSVALVAMVNSTSDEHYNRSEDCPGNNSTANSDSSGEFTWSPRLQGIILGSFFYGYIITQLPGGWLAQQFGGKHLYGLGILCTSVLTLLTPLSARLSVYVLIAVRVLEGVGEGVTFPAMHAILARWAPPLERSKLGTFIYAGAQFGTVISLPISGLLCDSHFLGGWPSVFYVFGSMGCIWYFFWLFLVFDSPDQHPRISSNEKQYIHEAIGHRETLKVDTPWVAIASSSSFWAILVAHVCFNWGFYTLLTTLPAYMKDVLHFDISQNGFLSALPYVIMWLTINASGQIADFLRHRGILSTTVVRKIFTALGNLIPAVFLILAGFSGCDPKLAVLCICLGVGGSGCALAGHNVNHLDIAPSFAGTLMGLTNCAATLPGILAPYVVKTLTRNHLESPKEQWQRVFYIAAIIYAIGTVAFSILGSGNLQKWAVKESDDQRTLLTTERILDEEGTGTEEEE